MKSQFHRLLSCTSSAAVLFAAALPLLNASQTAEKAAKNGAQPIQSETADSSKQEPDTKQTVPTVARINSQSPLLVTGGFQNLPERKLDEVRWFDTDKAFQDLVKTEKLTVWPIAKLGSSVKPEDEAAFRSNLMQQAARLGADYVIFTTVQTEVDRYYPPNLGQFVCYAQAYKRMNARLGECEKAEVENSRIYKVSGLVAGTKAEESGLRVGDVIKKVDGVPFGSNERYWSKAVRWKAGDKINIELEREGKPLTLELVLSTS